MNNPNVFPNKNIMDKYTSKTVTYTDIAADNISILINYSV